MWATYSEREVVVYKRKNPNGLGWGLAAMYLLAQVQISQGLSSVAEVAEHQAGEACVLQDADECDFGVNNA